MRKKTIAIFGGGISGLTASYELALLGHNVSLYESSDSFGGLAKSKYSEGRYTERSWRGYGSIYINLNDIFDQLGIMDNLKDKIWMFPKDDGTFSDRMSILDYIKLGKAIFFAKEKNILEKDVGTLSRGGIDRVNNIICPALGVDSRTFPTLLLKRLIEIHIQRPKGLRLLNGPTSDVFINTMVNKLKSLKVKLHLNNKLTYVKIKNRKIKNVTCGGVKITADKYIFAINPYLLYPILSHIKDSQIDFLGRITEDDPAINISFSMKFNKRFDLPKKENVLMLPDSEYNITMYFQDSFWNDGYIPKDEALWSGTACMSHRKGKVTGKTIEELKSKEDFIDEIEYQIGRNRKLQEMIGRNFMEHLVETRVWDGWKFSRKYGPRADQPHWITTVNNYLIKPEQKTTINNMIFAGAHTKTNIMLFSMEGAAESGRRAANIIDSRVPILSIETISLDRDILTALLIPPLVFLFILFVIMFSRKNKI